MGGTVGGLLGEVSLYLPAYALPPQAKVTLRPTASQSVRFGVEPHFGL
jgi:hypothetical protein